VSGDRPDVLVIGAGIAGTSLAAELAAAGATVTVVEATQVCGGSSGLNAGGVRQQFSEEINVELARRTVESLTELRAANIVDLNYHQNGYLFIARTEATAAALQRSISLQNTLDVPTQWLTPSEISDLVPGVDLEEAIGASFCVTDGYLDPHSWVTYIADKARRAGVRFLTGTKVVGINHTGFQATAAALDSGDHVHPRIMVNCAGAWASSIAETYGASLPILAWRSHCFLISGVSSIPSDAPMTIDFDNGKTWFHPERANELLTGTDADGPCASTWSVPVDRRVEEVLAPRLMRMHQAFESASVKTGWAGLLELTPDDNPICDWTHFDNLYTMAGFSAHGLPLAPSLATQAAKVLTGAAPDIDITPYRADRFNQPAAQDSPERMSMR
jgi:sarcosine oxidase subunit beta